MALTAFFYREGGGGMRNQSKIFNQNPWCGLVSFSKAVLKLLQIMVRSDGSPVSAYTHPLTAIPVRYTPVQTARGNELSPSLTLSCCVCMQVQYTVCVVCSGKVFFLPECVWVCTLVRSKGKEDTARISFSESTAHYQLKRLLSS